MISVEEASGILPAGTRVWDRHRNRYGTVAVRQAGIRAGQTYDTDVSGWCCSVNVLWDDGHELWTSAKDLTRADTPKVPDLLAAVNAAMTELGKGFAQMRRSGEATGAMAAAYRGDLDSLRTALGALPAGQVREISAAAALLTSTADQVLGEADAVPEEEA